MSTVQSVVWDDEVSIWPDGEYRFPDKPGVYAFAEVSGGGINVRYVGRASNLAERIDGHFQESDNSCWRECCATRRT